MEINPEILEILAKFNIDRDRGLLCLLSIFFNLDTNAIIPEDIIKGINMTKIVEKKYRKDAGFDIVWNVRLFGAQVESQTETDFNWVIDWVENFRRINPSRAGSWRDAIPRMKAFMSSYGYSRETIYRATDLYLSGIKNSEYLMFSHKFIFDGVGAMRKSTLLMWCEKVSSEGGTSQQRGRVIT